MNKKGFTLVELMVVIVIIGVLAAVALPKFSDAINKGRASEAPKKLNEVIAQASIYEGETGNYPTAVGDGTGTTIAITGTSKFFTYTGAPDNSGATSEFMATATGKAGAFNGGVATLSTTGAKTGDETIKPYIQAFLNN